MVQVSRLAYAEAMVIMLPDWAFQLVVWIPLATATLVLLVGSWGHDEDDR